MEEESVNLTTDQLKLPSEKNRGKKWKKNKQSLINLWDNIQLKYVWLEYQKETENETETYCRNIDWKLSKFSEKCYFYRSNKLNEPQARHISRELYIGTS